MLQSTEDSLASYSTAQGWTVSRRLGLLLRTKFDRDGATLSLHDVSTRTHGRISTGMLYDILATRSPVLADPVIAVILAQAFDVDPDFFVRDEDVRNYIQQIDDEYAASGRDETEMDLTIQLKAHALHTWSLADEEVVA